MEIPVEGANCAMKRIVFLTIVMASLAVSGFAATPGTWNSYVDSWLNYSPIPSDPAFTEISAYTPETAVVVTRIEIDAHVGPLNNSTNPFSPCVTNPSLTIAGGAKSYTLTLTTPPNLSTGGLHSYTDSGALSLRFAAGTRLVLTANQGDSSCSGGNQVNIVVHYGNPSGE
jgi:hypothetical protein